MSPRADIPEQNVTEELVVRIKVSCGHAFAWDVPEGARVLIVPDPSGRRAQEPAEEWSGPILDGLPEELHESFKKRAEDPRANVSPASSGDPTALPGERGAEDPLRVVPCPHCKAE